jgi:hypothetical protein
MESVPSQAYIIDIKDIEELTNRMPGDSTDEHQKPVKARIKRNKEKQTTNKLPNNQP